MTHGEFSCCCSDCPVPGGPSFNLEFNFDDLITPTEGYFITHSWINLNLFPGWTVLESPAGNGIMYNPTRSSSVGFASGLTLLACLEDLNVGQSLIQRWAIVVGQRPAEHGGGFWCPSFIWSECLRGFAPQSSTLPIFELSTFTFFTNPANGNKIQLTDRTASPIFLHEFPQVIDFAGPQAEVKFRLQHTKTLATGGPYGTFETTFGSQFAGNPEELYTLPTTWAPPVTPSNPIFLVSLLPGSHGSERRIGWDSITHGVS